MLKSTADVKITGPRRKKLRYVFINRNASRLFFFISVRH